MLARKGKNGTHGVASDLVHILPEYVTDDRGHSKMGIFTHKFPLIFMYFAMTGFASSC